MNTKTTPKDFFLHLGATVALYVAAGALINLCLSVINYYFPDAMAGYFYGSSVAWPISILFVLVPMLYILEWLINRDVALKPEKNDLWIRRWRMYLTLFLSVALVGGDLIALINVYLNGEITARFVYKTIAILLVASTIGKYYFFSIFTSFKWSKNIRKVHAWFGIVLVLVAIIFGFIAVGSPATQRALRFDQQRVNDLQNIQWQIISHWQQKQKLPAGLAELNDTLSGYIIPMDPDTNVTYEYHTKCLADTGNVIVDCRIPLSFELCATFSRASQDVKGRGTYDGRGPVYLTSEMAMVYPSPGPSGDIEDVWNHKEGRSCFVRTIDPDKYPVNRPMQVEYRK